MIVKPLAVLQINGLRCEYGCMDTAEPRMIMYQGDRRSGKQLAWLRSIAPLSPMAAAYHKATTVPTIYIDEICRIDERDWEKLVPTVNKEWIRRVEK